VAWRNLREVWKEKVARLAPDATVTDAGTDSVLVEELSATTKPLVEADPESVTVQLPDPPG